ncbi:hypothetical protein L1887_29204 [Cichorium endivia]|nr:hypothetical protein L1887_29204 [Cichorium endivia]
MDPNRILLDIFALISLFLSHTKKVASKLSCSTQPVRRVLRRSYQQATNKSCLDKRLKQDTRTQSMMYAWTITVNGSHLLHQMQPSE